MIQFKSPIIDDIKKGYEYKVDPFETSNTAIVIYYHLYGHIFLYIPKLFIQWTYKRDKIDKNILQSFGKTLKEISDGGEKMIKKVEDDTDDIGSLIGNITYDYIENKDKPGAQDTYLKIGRNILDKEINIYIQYEKILISYNVHIINIIKNLTN